MASRAHRAGVDRAHGVGLAPAASPRLFGAGHGRRWLNGRRIRSTIRAVPKRPTLVEPREMTYTFDPKLATADSVEAGLLQQLDPGRLPRHVAIIMDGNGRWARQRRQAEGLGPPRGYRRPCATRSRTAARLGIEVLSAVRVLTRELEAPALARSTPSWGCCANTSKSRASDEMTENDIRSLG